MIKKIKSFSLEKLREIKSEYFEKHPQYAGEDIDQELADVWSEYVEVRNQLAASRFKTENSQKRSFQNLLRFSKENLRRIVSAEQSMDSTTKKGTCWIGFFAIKYTHLDRYKERKAKQPNIEKNFPTLQNPVKKFDKMAIIKKQAANGSISAIALLKRMNNPQIVASEKSRETFEREEALKKKIAADSRKGKGLSGFGMNK